MPACVTAGRVEPPGDPADSKDTSISLNLFMIGLMSESSEIAALSSQKFHPIIAGRTPGWGSEAHPFYEVRLLRSMARAIDDCGVFDVAVFT
jgi:hypothetical protein